MKLVNDSDNGFVEFLIRLLLLLQQLMAGRNDRFSVLAVVNVVLMAGRQGM